MRIIDITKQYIDKDSNIAKPTNKVRVIVGAESGCCAIEFNADEIDFPCPIAGIITPIPVVIPAVTIDATAMIVELSIVFIFIAFLLLLFSFLI